MIGFGGQVPPLRHAVHGLVTRTADLDSLGGVYCAKLAEDLQPVGCRGCRWAAEPRERQVNRPGDRQNDQLRRKNRRHRAIWWRLAVLSVVFVGCISFFWVVAARRGLVMSFAFAVAWWRWCRDICRIFWPRRGSVVERGRFNGGGEGVVKAPPGRAVEVRPGREA